MKDTGTSSARNRTWAHTPQADDLRQKLNKPPAAAAAVRTFFSLNLLAKQNCKKLKEIQTAGTAKHNGDRLWRQSPGETPSEPPAVPHQAAHSTREKLLSTNGKRKELPGTLAIINWGLLPDLLDPILPPGNSCPFCADLHSSLRICGSVSTFCAVQPPSYIWLASAVDRYWAVTNVDYIRVRTGKTNWPDDSCRVVISLAISLPARFTLTDELRRTQIANGTCAINEDTVYTIFSTVGAFYPADAVYDRHLHQNLPRLPESEFVRKPSRPEHKRYSWCQNQQRQESNLGTPQADDLPEAEQGPQQQQQTILLLSLNLLAKQNCKS
uniref:Uncharacterized protein n=1 Tax=Macrostomum lignano TaxID=282301 RepID=A0A1I8JR82_9PLAT